ncbi:GGDEF domain-containing protein [Planctomycetota bacterium]
MKKALLILLAVALFPLVAYFDRRTGFEYSFVFFYLAIIVSLTWYGGRAVGYTLIAIGTVTIMTFDYYQQRSSGDTRVVVWDTFWGMMTLFLGVLLVNRLRRSLDNEKQLARTDALTGLSNRRFFEEMADRSWEWCRRHKQPISLGYLDLDNFKTVNDTRGHDEGDRLLVEIAGCIKQNLRKTDLVARIGGDEFVLFLPETHETLAESIAQRLQESIHTTAREHRWPISASIGIVTDHTLETPLTTLIQKTDSLMYAVKQSGRGAVKMEII